MGDCVICGRPAGFFKSRHPACALEKERADDELRQAQVVQAAAAKQVQQMQAELIASLRAAIYETIRLGSDLVALETQLLDAIVAGKLTHSEMTELLVSGYERSVEAFLEDGLLDPIEEDRLVQCQNRFALSQATLDRSGAFMRVGKAAILRRVMEGEVPNNVSVEANGMVNYQRGEIPVWLFANCQYLEDTARRQIVGRSQGMSFKVMSGVYYRVGGFKGEPVTTIERKNLGEGLLVVTNMNLYFVGPGKTTRIPYTKIVSFTPYSDAVGIMRDAATAKPQMFMVDDPWFAYNLITNLAQIH